MNPSSRSAFTNHVLLYTLVALGFSGTIGVGTVWMQHQIALVAQANKDIEARIHECERKSEQLTTEIAEEEDVAVLLARNARWKLGLVPPAPQNIQDITDDPVAHMLSKHNRELFSEPGASVSIRVAAQP